MKKILLILICVPLLLFSQEEKRLALVIGNANYDKGELKNPVNDALLISETLKKLEFDVILDTNITDRSSFYNTIKNFGEKRIDYDIAFVYYAGHAIQVNSKNYLLPTKEVFESEYDVKSFGVSVQDILYFLENMSDQVNILVLDACRDNPFESNLAGRIASRSLKGNGLAKIPPPTGSLIAFSTEPGRVALDGDDNNSKYCEILSRNLLIPNIDIKDIFQRVRTEMVKLTGNLQVPEEFSKLTGDSYYLSRSRVYVNHEDIFTMFYNVENLFDTIDDPYKNDNDFLPEHEKNWDTEKYNHKLNQLTHVFSSINNGKFPEIIGLCEVENKNVIEDLLNIDFFNNHRYKIIHQDSPDFRGIDCAILIDTSRMDVLSYEFIEIKIQGDRPARDIIHVKIRIQDEVLHVFVNHWPSRWGGADKTEYKRIYAAEVLQSYLSLIGENEHFLIMGDFNDTPDNESTKMFSIIEGLEPCDPDFKDFLRSSGFTENEINFLCSKTTAAVNLMIQLMEVQKGSIGSYNFNGKWSYLDQIIVDTDMYYGKNTKLMIKDYNVFSPEWLMYFDSKGRKKPNRTFGGNKWYRGFSDHLPIYCRLKLLDCRQD